MDVQEVDVQVRCLETGNHFSVPVNSNDTMCQLYKAVAKATGRNQFILNVEGEFLSLEEGKRVEDTVLGSGVVAELVIPPKEKARIALRMRGHYGQCPQMVCNAATAGDRDTLQLCIDAEYVNDSSLAGLVLKEAARHGFLDIVTCLVGKDDKLVLGEGKTAILFAAQEGHVGILQCLLEAGAKTVSRYDSALGTAVDSLQMEAIRLLMQWAQEDEKYVYGLNLAAGHQSPSALECVLSSSPGIDVNRRDSDGATALMHASLTGCQSCVQMLLSRGADVNQVDNYHRTSIMYAVRGGNITALKLLLQSGADATLENCGGQSALRLAMKYGNEGIIDLLKEVLKKSKRVAAADVYQS